MTRQIKKSKPATIIHTKEFCPVCHKPGELRTYSNNTGIFIHKFHYEYVFGVQFKFNDEHCTLTKEQTKCLKNK
jgi:hypothetical protein